MAILNLLREMVRDDDRTQTAIAVSAGIHPKTFSAFMHGRRGLAIETIEKLAIALGMEVSLCKRHSR